jgi:hypothetical protein
MGQINPANLTITNYQLLSQVPATRTLYYYTYAASLTNSGPAIPAITATITSNSPAATVMSGKGNLQFPAVAQNATVPSLNTFTIEVDRTQTFNFTMVTWSYNAPVANAGPNQSVSTGTTVTLDGSGSTNPSGIGTLTYSWQFLSIPSGSTTTITNPTAVMPTFLTDVAGTYTIQLTVTNGAGSDTSTVTVVASGAPPPPVANAGPNQMLIKVGATVFLSGSLSHDFNNKPLSYSWTIIQKPTGSNATLTGANTVSPSFVADVATTSSLSYMVQLVVNDTVNNSSPSIVTITTTPPPPVANPGQAQSVFLGTTVQLNGSLSTDSNNQPLTYTWSFNAVPTGNTATLSNASIVNPTFTPNVVGTYVVQLIVNDTVQNSSPATVTITVTATQTPTANAGPAETYQIGSLSASPVQLTGMGSDPQGLPLTYSWTFTPPSGSKAVLSSSTISNPTFTPDMIGQYTATLTVNNGHVSSSPSSVTITIVDATPIANAGAAQKVPVGTLVTMNGNGSSDSNNVALKYTWSFLSTPENSAAILSGANTVAPTFTADLAGIYVLQLVVNDTIQNSLPVTTIVTAGPTPTFTFSPAPLNLTNEGSGTLTITSSDAAGTAGVVVTLSVADPTIATAPTTVTIMPGQLSATVTVTPVGLGSTSLFASATAYQPNDASINVNQAALSLTLAGTVGIGNMITGTITLNAPAPSPNGVTVTLSPNQTGFVTISPLSVTIPAGQTTGTFNVTGGPNQGGPTVITASATGFTSAQTSIVSLVLGTITVQQGVTTGPGQSTAIAVSLGSATSNDITITLTSSDTTKVTVSPSVLIKAGTTTPVTPAQVTGVNFGTATITATATGFVTGSASVTVSSTLSFTQQTLTVSSGTTGNLTLNLTGNAPSNLIIPLQSDNTAVATVPSSVTIAQGLNSATVTVTGVALAQGTAHISTHAGNSFITDATATVNVVTGLAITTASPLPSGVTNTAYSTTVVAQGGTSPYSWSATGLPSGLSINSSSGVISGTPSATSTSSVIVTVKDSSNPQLSNTATLSLSIVAPLSITTTSLPVGVVNQSYGFNMVATGGTTPYIWSATGLPQGLSINTSTGQIAGQPSGTPGPSSVTVTLKDSTNPQLSTSASFTLTVVTGLAITSTSPLPLGIVGTAYNTTLTAQGGTTPYTWSATGLPQGLSINTSTGAITGTPSGTPGLSTVNVTVTDKSNPQQTVNLPFSLTVIQPLAITTTTLPQGTVNTAYNFTVLATGGTPSYQWSATGLAAFGLVINSSTGAITGNPSTAGTGSVVVTVKDATNPQQSATATLSLTIVTALSITTPSPLPSAVQNAAYSTTVVASGGTTPYQWSATGLPGGLSINAGSGVISGTATATGTSTVAVTVKDSSATQLSTTANLSLTVVSPLTITTTSPLPSGVQNVAYNQTVLATGGTTPYTWQATNLPIGLSINSTTGVISGTPTSAQTTTAIVTVTDSTSPHQVANATLSITIGTQLAIQTQSPLPQGIVNTAYNATVTAVGGTTPLTWSATGLPTGLSINPSTGVIGGTPSAAGTTSATITVKDSSTPQQTASGPFSLTIAGVLQITTTSPLPQGFVGTAYTPTTVLATGGITPYIWSATNLPSGLSINASTGVISGTPSGSAGTTTPTISVKDSGNPQQNASAPLSITIVSPLTFSTTSPLPAGVLNTAYSTTMVVTGGTPNYSWSATGLPAGLSITSSTGVISGTPSAIGTTSATITVKDSSTPQLSASGTFSITITGPLTIQTSSPLPNGIVGTAYSTTVAAVGGTPNYSWSATGLPAGLSIAASTGVISGTPSGSGGTTTATISVKDSSVPQQSASAQLSITIATQLAITTTSPLPSGTYNQAYLTSVAATGGTPSYSWSESGLPTGLSINSGTGAISGTPTTYGTFTSVAITVKDSGSPQQSKTATFTLYIMPPPLTILTTSLAQGQETVSYSGPAVQATGGTLPYSWSAPVCPSPTPCSSGLPFGLSISQTTGVINGTPAAGTAGTYSVPITVTDSGTPTPQVASTTLSLTVVTGSFLTNSTPQGTTVGQNLAIPVLIGLSVASPGLPNGQSCTVNTPSTQGCLIVSSNGPGTVLLSSLAGSAGSTAIAIPTSAGTTSVSFYAYGLSSSGSATLTATLFSYTATSVVITAGPSGFVLAGPNGNGGSFTTGESKLTTLTASSVLLNSSLNVVATQAVAGGVNPVVTFTTSPSSLGTTPGSLTFTGGNSSLTTNFTSGTTVESGTITLNEPTGFTTPANSLNLLPVSVVSQSLSCTAVTVGFNLETPTSCSLTGNTATNLTVTLTSNSSSLTFAPDAAGTLAGVSSITLTIFAGTSSTRTFYVYGGASSGTATYTPTTSPTSIAANPGNVTFAPSGFVLDGPFGLGSAFPATVGGQDSINVEAALLDSSGNYLSSGTMAGGVSASVTVNSSNTTVGTISGSPTVVSNATGSSGTVNFNALAAGSTTLTVVQPTGYTAPLEDATLQANVAAPSLLILDFNGTVGNSLEDTGLVYLPTTHAPAGGLPVIVTVTSGAIALSQTGTDAGSGQITVTIPANSNFARFYVYGQASSGAGTFSVNAASFQGTSATENLAPSAVVIDYQGNFGFNNVFLAQGAQTLTVQTAVLNGSGGFSAFQPLAGSNSLTVNLTDNNTPVATINPTAAVIPAGPTGGSANITFTPVSTGTAIISVVEPSGYNTPTDNSWILTMSVN